MNDYGEFQFDRSSLTRPRKPGISAYVRVKNDEQFLRLAILSHLEFYDEIIAVYNDCTDRTPEILRELAAQHPEKIRVYHYLPKVIPAYSAEHARTPSDSVHGLASYYNYALSKTNFNTGVKLDADHLAIPQNLAPWIAQVRADIAAGRDVAYCFTGINMMRGANGEIGVNENDPFSGVFDIFYHSINEESYYENVKLTEGYNQSKQWKRRYMGVLYFHLKYLGRAHGYANMKKEDRERMLKNFRENSRFVSWEEFHTRRCHWRISKPLAARHRARIFIFLHRLLPVFPLKNYLRYKWPVMRILQLKSDLQKINLRRDLLDKLAAGGDLV